MGIIVMQDIKPGVSFILDGQPFIALKSEFSKSGRNAAVMKLKIRNLFTGQIIESVYKAADKVEEIVLDLRPMQFSYIEGETYIFMDNETFDQVEVSKTDLGTSVNYIIDNMEMEIGFYEDRAVDVRIPITVERTIIETEPGLKGDTTGRSLKRAKIETGYELMVPLFCENGTKIKIDTRTGEYLERVK